MFWQGQMFRCVVAVSKNLERLKKKFLLPCLKAVAGFLNFTLFTKAPQTAEAVQGHMYYNSFQFSQPHLDPYDYSLF